MTHTYDAAERFLLSREFFGMKLGLENVSSFLASIGSPQERYPTIHVAGTNGKGSCCAMLAAILQEAGYKTGLFTSPHLVSLRERVRVDGRLIPRRSVAAYVDRHRRELVRRKLSFFEVITAMAFEHYARTQVDVAVIETGLGGRLDATNVLTPELTLTTDIDFDHMEILGPTIRKIAAEKAGIIKPGVPHLIGMLRPDAEDVMRRRCGQVGAPLVRLDPSDFGHDIRRNRLDFHSNGLSLRGLAPILTGDHQLRNAALVVKAVGVLRERGFRISNQALRKGLQLTHWPGRFQLVKHRGRPLVILDVGHNRAGVAAFVTSFQHRYVGRKAHIITGFVMRKQHQDMFDSLAQIAESFSLVPLKTKRSVDVKAMIASTDFSGVPARRCGSLSTAFARLLKSCDRDDIIVVAGSHYLVGEFLDKFGP